MTRRSLILIVVVLAVALGGALAYTAYQQDQNTLDITIGRDGVQVD